MCALVGLSDATASTTPANKVSKRRKTTCTHCRQRKSKCDGVSPQCSTCIAYRTTCRYDKPPSLAYVRSLEARIEQLVREANVRVAQAGASEDGSRENASMNFTSTNLSGNNGTTVSDAIDDTEEPLNAKRDWVTEISTDGNGGVSYHNPTSSIHQGPLQHTVHSSIDPHSAIDLTESVSTSGSHGQHSPDSSSFKRDQTSDIKVALVTNAARQKRNEELALKNVALHSDISKEMGAELLNLHWCWIHPLFCIVYRPAFINGMAASASIHAPEPRYFSDTLLKIIYAHSSRFLVGSPGGNDSAPQFLEMLAEKAYLSVGMRISSPSSIPMIQGFLLLSAREIAFGRSSQAWLYSGMAFRMAIDLGIHFPSDRLQEYVKTLSVEDVEIRKRLFWSCYTWDKTISIYLGRMPAFTPPVDAENISFLDDFTETELWEPYYGSLPRNDHNTRLPYTPVEGRVMSCFVAHCKLSVILSSVMLEIYGTASAEVERRANATASKTSFNKIRSDLKNWWLNLTPNLKLESERLGSHSQPPHIVSLNLLYHTTLILLHRPFILSGANFNSTAVQRSYQVCLEATGNIYDLLTLLVNTFGYQHVSYINSYSAYIASTIAVLHYEREQEVLNAEQVQSLQGQNRSSPILQNICQSPGGYTLGGNQENLSGERLGLRFFLEVMQRTARTMPAMRRSVDIVKHHMHTILETQTKRHLASLFHSASHLDDNELAHINFNNGNGHSNGNGGSFGPWIISQAQNGVGGSQNSLSPTHSQGHSQQNGNSNSGNGAPTGNDHYPRPVLPPMIFKTETTDAEDEALYSGTFYPYSDEGLPAFPAQDLSMGMDMGEDFMSNRMDSESTGPVARQIFRGLNLDPHLRLNHADENGGWDTTF